LLLLLARAAPNIHQVLVSLSADCVAEEGEEGYTTACGNELAIIAHDGPIDWRIREAAQETAELSRVAAPRA